MLEDLVSDSLTASVTFCILSQGQWPSLISLLFHPNVSVFTLIALNLTDHVTLLVTSVEISIVTSMGTKDHAFL